MFNKDPIVYANPHPAESDYGYGHSNPAVAKNASLRIRSGQPSLSQEGEEPSSSIIDARGSEASVAYPQPGQMRFQNLPNRSDFSPSGITSGFSERESPQRQPGHIYKHY